MSDLLPRLQALDPERTPNAALFAALGELDARNRALQEQMLLGLDEQDALAAQYARLTAALLARQGQARPAPPAPDGEFSVTEIPLANVWN